MGSEENSKGIDPSVGGLVWVRRRNGSWWPGRIVAVDELAEGCLVSPRSGTPVKLLGREDASVDWYNLEKSKRVKAFQCGDFDECIEKAKVSAANSNKKAVKYARREDAIIHALEIENARKSDETYRTPKVYSSATNLDTWVREPQSMVDPDNDHKHMPGSLYKYEGSSTQELSQSGLSFEDPNFIDTAKEHFVSKKRRKTPNDSEDDGTEGTKRMKGLEDLGVGADLNRKSNKPLISEKLHELVQRDCASLSESDVGHVLSNGNPSKRSKVSSSSLKRRRSQVSNFHESMKRKDRRRPLTKVLESTAMVSVPVFCDQGASPGQSSLQGVTENKVSTLDSNESKKASGSPVLSNNSDCTRVSCEKEISPSASVHTSDGGGVYAAYIRSEIKENGLTNISEFPENDCTDGLYEVPFVGEGKYTKGFSKSNASGELQSGASGRLSSRCNQVGSVSLSNEGRDESGSTNVIIHGNIVDQRAGQDTSKWQLKGKRNSRNLSKRISKKMDSRRSLDRDNYYSNVYLEGKHHMDKLSGGNTIDESLMSDNCNQVAESRMSEDMGDGSQHLTNQMFCNETLSIVAKSKIQLRSKEICLTSSIPISSQRLLPRCQSRFTPHSRYHSGDVPNRNICGGSSLFDVNLEVGASYPGQHVPLVSLMSKLNGKAIVGHPLTVQVLDESYCDLLIGNIKSCPTTSYIEQPMNLTNSSFLLDKYANALPIKHAAVHRSTSSPKKSSKKKKSGLSSKKIRRLSSLTHKQKEEKRKPLPLVEKSRGPITCVPLKVVFSRINEALNRSSKSTCHI